MKVLYFLSILFYEKSNWTPIGLPHQFRLPSDLSQAGRVEHRTPVHILTGLGW